VPSARATPSYPFCKTFARTAFVKSLLFDLDLAKGNNFPKESRFEAEFKSFPVGKLLHRLVFAELFGDSSVVFSWGTTHRTLTSM
jgi:hypothetical protein